MKKLTIVNRRPVKRPAVKRLFNYTALPLAVQ
jgi:hypothetical protein